MGHGLLTTQISTRGARLLAPLILATLGLVGLAAAAFAQGGEGGEGGEGLPDGYEADHVALNAASDEVGGATIFWPDDRVAIPDTTEAPWRSVVWLETHYPDGSVAYCSGSLIDSDTVLTAAHCVYDDVVGYALEVYAAPGADGSTVADIPYGIAIAPGHGITVPSGWVDSVGQPRAGRTPYDVALVHLDAPEWGESVSPYVTLAAAPDWMFNDPNALIASAGFPGDKPSGTMWFTAGFAVDLDPAVIWTRMDAYPGQSGSPIYLFNEVEEFVVSVGVFSAEGPTHNAAARFSPTVITALRDWCVDRGCDVPSIIVGEDIPTSTPTSVPPTSTPTTVPTLTATIPASPPTATPTVVPAGPMVEQGAVPALAREASSQGGSSPPIPTPTPTQPPAATATPTVAPPTATPTPTGAAYSYSGTGDDVVDVGLLAPGFWWVDLTHNGQSNFIVWARPDDGFDDLLANEIGTYEGRRWMEGGDDYLIEIDADGAWTLELDPMGAQQSANSTFAGRGDDVSGLFTPSPNGATTWTLAHDGDSNFIVWLECDAAWDLVENDIGPVSSTTVVDFGSSTECYWDVTADGNWSITRQ